MMDGDEPTPGNDRNDDYKVSERPRSPAEALEPARAPEPPRARLRRKPHPAFAIMNGIMSLLVVVMLAAGGVFYFAKVQFDRPGPLAQSKVIVIPRGVGVNVIASRLEDEGIIGDRRVFVASVIYFKAQDKLKAGEYEFRRHASMRQVIDALVEGRSILHRVTIPEGLTSQQIVEILNEHDMLEGTVPEAPPEGSLLPDTYKFSRGISRQEMIERMQAEQRSFMAKMWDKRAGDLPFKTPQEAIVLASIVEKETARADERPRIASVFINRLKKNMRLQSDPTIVYGITGGKAPLGRPILRSEIDRETPYNTYQIKGLPPTPIANPGRAAIEAVLRPAKTQDIYFVADGSGGHAFSTTLSEHNSNVANWREIEREMRAKEEEAKRQAAAGGDASRGNDGSGQPEAAPLLSLDTIPDVLARPGRPAPAAIPQADASAAAKERASQAGGDAGAPPIPERNPRLR